MPELVSGMVIEYKNTERETEFALLIESEHGLHGMVDEKKFIYDFIEAMINGIYTIKRPSPLKTLLRYDNLIKLWERDS